jgi:acetyl esterase/lipase
VSEDDPPFLIMHGDKDPLVPLNQSELLAEALRKARVPVTFHVVKGAGHGFGGPENQRRVRDFFAEHLKKAKIERPPAESASGVEDAPQEQDRPRLDVPDEEQERPIDP